MTAETGKPLLESYTAELFLALEQLRWTAASAEQVIGAEQVRFTQPYLRLARPAPARALRRRRGDHAVELPVRDPVHTDHCGRGGRQLGRGQAVRARAAHGPGWNARSEEAGAPSGLVRVVQDAATGEQLVRARGMLKVFFTRS